MRCTKISDLNHTWGHDLSIDDQGDIAVVTGTVELSQRLVRRFLTNPVTFNNDGSVRIPPDYRFEPTFGAGARQYVDSVVSNNASDETLQTIKTRFLAQCSLEPEVSSVTPPVVTVVAVTGGVVVNAYVTMTDGQVSLIPSLEITQ